MKKNQKSKKRQKDEEMASTEKKLEKLIKEKKTESDAFQKIIDALEKKHKSKK